jgi:enoyl-CoA hydratase/carnithine racemase
MIDLHRSGDVFVLRLDHGENRFSLAMLDAVEVALDTVAETDGPRALVTTGTGKFFSNGLDLDWLTANGSRSDEYLARIHSLLAKVMSLPCPTAAACNGHTYAAGAMFALAHDRLTMREDRGFWCFPEVNLGLPFTPGMRALIRGRLPIAAAHEAMVTGRRYTGPEALSAGLVQAVATESALVTEAVAWAQALASIANPIVSTIRMDLYAEVLDALGPGGG